MEEQLQDDNFDGIAMSLDFDMDMPLFTYEADKLIDFELLREEYKNISPQSTGSDLITEIKMENEFIPEIFDPDEFLNDVVKKEVSSNDSDSSASHNRDSPSPSYSSGSSNIGQFANNILLDSPPVSPPQIISFSNFVPIQNIPVSTTNLQKNSKKVIDQIVLSPEDYKAFIRNNKLVINTQPTALQKEPIMLKSPTPVPHKVISSKPIAIDPYLDPKTLKRQQRMIKNRESAYMSRVKKKEYVTSLEEKIDQLNKENVQLKALNETLVSKLKQCTCNLNQIGVGFVKQSSPNLKKNVTIVFAILFTVSMNFSPLGNLLNAQHQNLKETPSTIHHSRSLLWIDEEIFNDQNSSSIGGMFNNSNVKKEICPFYINNQTENIRLASELRKWIGENGYKNLTNSYKTEEININSLSDVFEFKDTLDSMYKEIKDINSQMMKTFARKKKMAAKKIKSKKVKELQLFHKNRTHDIQLFNANFRYAEFFEEIGRKDDTFYVVSFSGEHLLLPALAHNKSNRPKMSLMLPARSDASEKITLMQIDCEVMNTSMISIREKFIPENLKNQNGRKEPSHKNSRPYTNPGVNVTSHNHKDMEKPFNLKRRVLPEERLNSSKRPYFINKIDESIRSDFGIY